MCLEKNRNLENLKKAKWFHLSEFVLELFWKEKKTEKPLANSDEEFENKQVGHDDCRLMSHLIAILSIQASTTKLKFTLKLIVESPFSSAVTTNLRWKFFSFFRSIKKRNEKRKRRMKQFMLRKLQLKLEMKKSKQSKARWDV